MASRSTASRRAGPTREVTPAPLVLVESSRPAPELQVPTDGTSSPPYYQSEGGVLLVGDPASLAEEAARRRREVARG